MSYELSKAEVRLFQAVTVVALSLSIVFQYVIIQSYLTDPKWKQLLYFNPAGEGYLELLVVFPACVLISGYGFLKAKEMG